MKTMTIGMIALVLGAGAAQGVTTFSFASDSDNTSFTWQGAGNTIQNANSDGNHLTLVIDDGNGPAPALTYDVSFFAGFSIASTGSIPAGGGRFLHTYGVNASANEAAGSFEFRLANGDTLLSATIVAGSFSALGTQGAWGTAAGLAATDNATAHVEHVWNGPDLPAYGLFHGAHSQGIDDAAFTFTFLQNAAGAPGVGLDGEVPGQWFAEGSYSGTANFVPAPGAMALLGLGGLAMARRRRA